MRGYPKRYVVYDTETVSRPGSKHGTRELVFRLGCAIGYNVFPDSDPRGDGFEFDDVGTFHWHVDNFYRSDDPIYLFAHNHGFDCRIMEWFRELAKGTYTLMPPLGVKRRGAFKEPLYVVESPPFLLRLWRADGQQLILSDTMNWLDMSLQHIGDWLGYPKGVMPHEDAPDAVWMTYCRRDVEVTDLALRRLWDFWRERGMQDWDLTLASGSMHLWRSRYGRRRIKQPEDRTTLDLDRHAYYGGRQEAFRLGRIEGPIYQVDVSSMYPKVMHDNFFPREVIDAQTQETKPTLVAPPYPGQTTAEVWLVSSDRAYPVRCAQGTLYCRGKVRTVLCGPELHAACAAGQVVRFGRWTRYRLSHLFTDFVHDLWTLRLAAKRDSDRVSDGLCKLLMNTLYGKFGQRAGRWVTHGPEYAPKRFGCGMEVGPDRKQDREFRIIAGVYSTRLKDELARGSFVPVAAWTTSYARVFMDTLRATAGPENVLYQNVDSLFVTQTGYDYLHAAGLIQDGVLGGLKLESTDQCVDIKGLGWIERSARPMRPGLNSSAVPVYPDVYAQDKWQGCDAAIRRGKVSSVSINETLIRLRESYSKQECLGDGRLRPWVISNWHLTPEKQWELPLPLSREQGSEDPIPSDD